MWTCSKPLKKRIYLVSRSNLLEISQRKVVWEVLWEFGENIYKRVYLSKILLDENWLQTIIANITRILYTLKHILRAIIENLRAEISFAAHWV